MHERRRAERSRALMTTCDEERRRGGEAGCGLEMTTEVLTEVEGASGEGESGGEDGRKGPPEVVYVPRGLLAKCLTCPICHKLFRDATTICECLHSFCRKCIYDKLTEEDLDCCPICDIHLGVLPVEKLRPDHSLQNVRAKLFPFKRMAKVPEEPPITLPVRRKERSLSSFSVSPLVALSSLTGRRTKGIAQRGILCGYNYANTEPYAKDHVKGDGLAENSCAAENHKLAANKRQKFSNAESSMNAPSKDADNCEALFQDKAKIWKPLNHLFEVANRTKSYRSPHCPNTKTEKTNCLDNEGISSRTRVKEHPNKSKVLDESNDTAESPSATAKVKKIQGRKRREGPNSAQALLDAANTQYERSTSPIWFSLVASFDQSGTPPLPQISTNYLRIKDGSLSVSFIQKYLVAKLNLASESEVEVTCHGQPVSPSMSMHKLIEQWILGGPSQKLQATVGASAKEFVMVLAYGRRNGSTQ